MLKFRDIGQVDLEKLRGFEATLSFQLPEDYRRFLEKHNGASFRGARYWVPDLQVEEDLDVLYGFHENPSLDIRSVRKDMDGEVPPNSIIIGDGVGGNLIVLQEGCVSYYDHQYCYPQSSDKSNAYRIADTFTDFLDSLKEPPSNV
jgi:hypothetical protein